MLGNRFTKDILFYCFLEEIDKLCTDDTRNYKRRIITPKTSATPNSLIATSDLFQAKYLLLSIYVKVIFVKDSIVIYV